jgi:hypothetical protein
VSKLPSEALVRTGLIAVMVATAALAAPAALAQDDSRKCANTEFTARSVALGEQGPFSGVRYEAGFVRSASGPNCRILTFYRLPPNVLAGKTAAERRKLSDELQNSTVEPTFAARYVDDKRGAAWQERWTDQARCPALVPQLAKLEPILAPKITGPGAHPDFMSGPTEQPTIRFWLAGPVYGQHDPDYTMSVAVEGGRNEAFGQWLDETFKALDSCWSADKPAAP